MRKEAKTKKVSQWIECRCPDTNKLLFKINLRTLCIEHKARKKVVYLEWKNVLSEREE